MNDPERQDLERQILAEREKVRQLEERCSELSKEAAILRNQLETYKPLAEQWWRERGPSKEECEAILKEIIAHPEKLLDMEDVVRELEEELKDRQKGDHAA